MHIEPGALNAAKLLVANVTALTTLGALWPRLLGNRYDQWFKTGLAALFFSLFMESFHVPVGGSELHFIGASAVYLVFGFGPTLFGFALGLLLQGVLFEPADLVHLAVNTLSLVLPLMVAHYGLGQAFFRTQGQRRLRWAEVAKFDALFYTGVVLMVGFWLSLGEEPTPLQHWSLFAASYIPVALCEPLLSCLVVRLLKNHADRPLIRRFTRIPALTLA